MKNMRKETVLRVGVIAEWVVIIIAVIASFVFIGDLPEPLLEYTSRDALFCPLDVIDAVVLAASIAASIGLYFFRRWARPIYAASTIWLSVSTAFGNPSVEPPIVSAMEEISLLIAGLLIGMSYFGGIARFDAQQSAQVDAPKSGAPLS
jgi:hypothetical protein